MEIIAINAGSSSVKIVVYAYGSGAKETLEHDAPLVTLVSAQAENIGQAAPIAYFDRTDGERVSEKMTANSIDEAFMFLVTSLQRNGYLHSVGAIGHRVVFGGPWYQAPAPVDETVLKRLYSMSDLDPDHMPGTLTIMRRCQEMFVDVAQIACFDSSFFADLPTVAARLPLPREYFDYGIRKYGYHGLSCESLLQTLTARGEAAASGRVVLAHLGSGASVTAVKAGRPIDTSMSLSPTSGIIMSTRSGDLDPTVSSYLMKYHAVSLKEYDELVNHKSGLLGLSGYSADMYTLLQDEATVPAAAEAIDAFCHSVTKQIGAMSALLGGLDLLVFSGGIGERSAVIRSRICEKLAFLGIRPNGKDSFHKVLALHTDEAAVIARHTVETLLQANAKPAAPNAPENKE